MACVTAVPVGRAVRAAHRSDARADRAALPAVARRSPVPRRDLRAVPVSGAPAHRAGAAGAAGRPIGRTVDRESPRSIAAQRRERPLRERPRDSTTDDRRLDSFARLRAMLALAPTVTWRSLFARVPERTPAVGAAPADRRPADRLRAAPRLPARERRDRQRAGRRRLRRASRRAEQGCCGALALHAGRLDEARAFARRTIEVFERAGVERDRRQRRRLRIVDEGIRPAARRRSRRGPIARARSRRGSATSPRSSSELGPPRAPRHPLALRVAYHDACHLAHAQGVRQPPRDLLRSIPGVELAAVRRAGHLLRQRRHLQPGRAGRRARSSATARPATSTPCSPDVSRPRTPAACCRWRAAARAPRPLAGRSATRSRSSTPRSAASICNV